MSATEGQTEFETRKRLHEEIKKFNRTEQEELFRILKRENEEVSENRNGIFFDLTVIKESTLLKIKEWIVFCKKNTTDFEEREKEIELLTKAQECQECQEGQEGQ
jgi:hypothetical protein